MSVSQSRPARETRTKPSPTAPSAPASLTCPHQQFKKGFPPPLHPLFLFCSFLSSVLLVGGENPGCQTSKGKPEFTSHSGPRRCQPRAAARTHTRGCQEPAWGRRTPALAENVTTLLPPLSSPVQQGTPVWLSLACAPAKAEMRRGFGRGALSGVGLSPLPTSPP